MQFRTDDDTNHNYGVPVRFFYRLMGRLAGIIACFILTGILNFVSAEDNQTQSAEETKPELQHSRYFIGVSYYFSERVLTCADFEGTATTSGPALIAGYETSRWSTSVLLGTARFDSDYTTVSGGVRVQLGLEADLYQFKTYYSSLRFHLCGNYFDGDGETGDQNTFVQLKYSAVQTGIWLTSELSGLRLYGGPLVSIVRGTYEPRGYQELDFEERHRLGVGGGLIYVPERWPFCRISAEVHYSDYVTLICGLAYRT